MKWLRQKKSTIGCKRRNRRNGGLNRLKRPKIERYSKEKDRKKNIMRGNRNTLKNYRTIIKKLRKRSLWPSKSTCHRLKKKKNREKWSTNRNNLKKE